MEREYWRVGRSRRGEHFLLDFHDIYRMAEVARGHGDHHTSRDVLDRNGVQEEIIEERRRDTEGRVGTFRYIKGKMLGKVSVDKIGGEL